MTSKIVAFPCTSPAEIPERHSILVDCYMLPGRLAVDLKITEREVSGGNMVVKLLSVKLWVSAVVNKALI